MILNNLKRPFHASQHSVVLFCMPEEGHFRRLQALIYDLNRRGYKTHVFTHCNFREQIERSGGIFFDLFSKYPLEQADATSFPVPCRYVSFAATYAEQIRYDIERVKPSLVIYDTFAVIGRVVAKVLDLPCVNVCSGHNLSPTRALMILQKDPRVKLSSECLRAVEILRDSYGLKDASPFSYISMLSPHLNIYCEPPEFLEECERRAFEPVVFYGSLPYFKEYQMDDQGNHPWFGKGNTHKFKVYISFGTVIWRSFPSDAIRALRVLAEAFSEVDKAKVVISLGRTIISKEALHAILRPNVTVESYVDQWKLLQEADVFVTHHGLNSTHEAIFHRVPMISYPFFMDQPALAEKCQKFGLAVPLTGSIRGEFKKEEVFTAFARLNDERRSIEAALERAREWEIAVIENRGTVLKRMEDLIR